MTNKTITLLKENNQDFEWYPTTNEILEAIHKDLLLISESQQTFFKDIEEENKYLKQFKSNIKWNYDYNVNNKTYNYQIDSLIDIGAGDGRVLNYFKTSNKYAIEKSKIHITNLIKDNVKLIGQDFYETILIDRNFDVCFSNPPYSIFKDFCTKIVQEVNASIIYFVIPERWKNDITLTRVFNKKGNVEVIGSYDFLEGDREARAKVDVIRIIPASNDTFNDWIESCIGEFKSNEDIELKEIDEEVKSSIINRKTDLVNILVDNYNNELSKLIDTYNKLGSIDFNIIEQLGLTRETVFNKIKDDIKALKAKYWHTSFNIFDEITSRLTEKKRNEILNNIQWFKQLDFNSNNIRTIVIWIIENSNKFTTEQMIDVYEQLSDFDKVKEYKSNEVWLSDKWRYNKRDYETRKQIKYSLDYRIVVGVSIGKYDYVYDGEEKQHKKNTIYDLCVVAKSLGYNIVNTPKSLDNDYNLGKHTVYFKNDLSEEDVLFEYTIYLNGNVHFKLNKEFLQDLNIEVGKARGWLRKPEDIKEEFKLSDKECIDYFVNTKLNLITDNKQLLLGL